MRLAPFMLICATILGACSGVTADGPEPSGGPGVTRPAGNTTPLPAVEVVDVATGDRVALDGLVPADRPTLIWFWAPH